MEEYFKLQQQIAPELIAIIEYRYAILRSVYRFQPIGRRSLAQNLDLSERTVRKHIKFLEEQNFLKASNAGSKITRRGQRILKGLDGYIKQLRGTSDLENKLSNLLNIEVYVVPSGLNYEQSQKELGRFAAIFIKDLISDEDIIAVTGGTTLATVAEMMNRGQEKKDVTVIPARGGLGEGVEIQSNTITAKIANKLGGKYKLLHIPDNLRQDTIFQLIEEKTIKEVLELARQADILIHGIGTAEVMAKRRKIPAEKIEKLEHRKAVGESFGYYFNHQGEIVYSTPSVGLKLSDLDRVDKVIAVAGGKNKAESILAVVSAGYQDILLTDEEAGKAILEQA